jgi:hypothetical protein
MTRLFTFGCSFTNYSWPMWSDLFGLEFDHYENWGVPGIGNIAIANRVTECHVKNNFTADDIIVVQWSSHIRNDYHLFRKPPEGRDVLMGWKTKGSIFNYLNEEIYDNKWIDNFFDEPSYVMLSLNAIHSTQLFLESTGCKWAMTSIGNFNRLGTDFIFEPGGYGEKTDRKLDLWEALPGMLPYKDKIWNDKFTWVEPIGTYCWQNKEELYHWQSTDDTEPWVDPHPSVDLSIDWLYNRLKPALELDNSKATPEQLDWALKCRTLKKTMTRLDYFAQIAARTCLGYNNTYKGF